MSSETYWGVWLHAVRPVAELAELAAHAEQLGAAAILVADEGTDRDLFVTLAAIALRTHRVRLFAAVTNPHSRHPVATAAAFASLAELAPGRIVAGFGAGGTRVLGPMALSPRKPFTALVDCLDIVEPLLRQESITHLGELSANHASLPWTSQQIPIAIAGRGPRVEHLATERADWILLAGRAIDRVRALISQLRSGGRQPQIAWNPSLAWTPELEAEVRGHLAYMVVDMPPADRLAVDVDPRLAATLRDVVTMHGPEHAGRLLPPAVLDHFAIAGCRSDVIARLRTQIAQIRPELVLFEAHDYSPAYIEDAAELAHAAGAAPYPLA